MKSIVNFSTNCTKMVFKEVIFYHWYSENLRNYAKLYAVKIEGYLHCKPIPVMKTRFSLCTFSHMEKPVFITWENCNENRYFPVWGKYTGKTLFWPCTGPVQDCSDVKTIIFKSSNPCYFLQKKTM